LTGLPLIAGIGNPLPFVAAGLVSGAVYALAAMGVVFTYKVSRVINFAFGAIAMFCAYSYWELRVVWHVPAIFSIPLVMIVLPTLLALITERFVYRSLEGSSLFAKTAASVGICLAIYGLALYIWTNPIQNLALLPPSLFPSSVIHLPGVDITFNQLGIFLSLVVIVAILYTYLKLTPSGVRLRAVVVNRDLAELRGINSVGITRLTWVIGYILASITGVLLASFSGSDPLTLTLVVVYALAGAVVGGMMSLPWAVVGGLVLGLANAFMVGYVPSGQFLSQLRLAVPFVVLLIALVAFSKRFSITSHGESRTALLADLAGAALSRRPRVPQLAARLVPIVIAVVILRMIGDNYALTLVSTGVAYGIIFLSYRVFTATTGLVSFAQSAFAGIGAFTAADLVTSSAHFPWALGVLVGSIVAALAGALVALPTVRLRGVFLVVATLAFAELVSTVVFSDQSFTGGTAGKSFPRPLGFSSSFNYLLLLLGMFVVLGIICEIYQYSVYGRQMQADLGSSLGARSIGIRTEYGRLVSFMLAAGLAGIGGCLLSSQIQVVDPTSWDVVPVVFVALVLVASGGLGSTVLMLQMGILSTVFPAIVSAIVPSLNQSYVAIFGILGLVALRIPGGAAGIEQRTAARVRAKFGGRASQLRLRFKRTLPRTTSGETISR
jgi:branched-subunit amino acid ABC-type transport system permease component